MAIFLCVYATDAEKNALEVLRRSALRVGGVDHVVTFDDTHPLIQTLKTKSSPTFQFDWQFWKPYVIHFTLHNVQDGDVVVYCDPTYHFTKSIRSHVNALDAKKPIGLCRLSTPKATQAKFCKQDCFNLMKCQAAKYAQAYQVDAGFQMYQKNDTTMAFLASYVEFCSNPQILDDTYQAANGPDFQQHRRQQSVLTNLRTRHASQVICFRMPLPESGPDPSKLCLDPILNHTIVASSPIPRTVVVTPTTGTSFLPKCIESVQRQTLPGVVHLIIIDGPQHAETVQAIVDPYRLKMPIHTMTLPFPAGAKGWLGHRIYASMAFLLDYDYISFLDEDNTVDPDHYQGLHDLLVRENLDWAFALRKIQDTDGNLVTHDNCESLGNMCHTVMAWNDFLVDTSCYFFTKPVAQATAPHWMHKARQPGDIEADRAVTRFLLGHPTFKGKGVPKHTLNYTAAQRGDSVKADFFVQGNAVFGYDFSAKKNLYVFHLGPETTEAFVRSMNNIQRSFALDDGALTLLRGLGTKYNLVNGYAMEPVIPANSLVLVIMGPAKDLPTSTLNRTDVVKIAYTFQPPGPECQQQWSQDFLSETFHHVLTYSTPLVEHESWATFCPYMEHALDFRNAFDMALLHTPTKPVADKRVVMVAECQGRQKFVENLKEITVYGMGWAQYKKNPRLRVGGTSHPSLREKTAVDIYKDFTFALIVENIDVAGYMGADIYDAWIAGCIPIYHGNGSPDIPQDTYIDLKKFKTSADLQKHLDSLSLETIKKMREQILGKRDELLRKVSTQAFAETFEKAYQKVATT